MGQTITLTSHCCLWRPFRSWSRVLRLLRGPSCSRPAIEPTGRIVSRRNRAASANFAGVLPFDVVVENVLPPVALAYHVINRPPRIFDAYLAWPGHRLSSPLMARQANVILTPSPSFSLKRGLCLRQAAMVRGSRAPEGAEHFGEYRQSGTRRPMLTRANRLLRCCAVAVSYPVSDGGAGCLQRPARLHAASAGRLSAEQAGRPEVRANPLTVTDRGSVSRSQPRRH
jgi:hypothetical protein